MNIKLFKKYSYELPLDAEMILNLLDQFLVWFKEEHPDTKYIKVYLVTVNTKNKHLSLCRPMPVTINSKLTVIKRVLTRNIAHLLEHYDSQDITQLIIYYELSSKRQIGLLNKNLKDYTTAKLKLADLSKFYRSKPKSHYFETNTTNGKYQILNDLKYIQPLTSKISDIFNIITLDIESILSQGIKGLEHIPFLISFYDGTNAYSFFKDINRNYNLFTRCFDQLFVSKYIGYSIYIHNSSHYDMILPLTGLKELVKYDRIISVNPIIKDNKFISVTILYKVPGDKKVYRMIFYDSFLLLLSSLAKLAKAFGVPIGKEIFPYYFPRHDNLDYVGEVPDYKYFNQSKVTLEDYLDYKSSFNTNWNLKQVSQHYCELDCIILHQILNIFRNEFIEEFGVDIIHVPTLPSLAMRLYRTHFLPKKERIITLPNGNTKLEIYSDTIPILNNDLYQILREGYYGGHVDMYKPTVDKKVYHYDINSLYPTAMNEFLYPANNVIIFEGDCLNELPSEYNLGLYLVEITTTKDLIHPFLPYRTENVLTIYPLGTWTGWYYSEELKVAKEKFGYEYKVLRGFSFESADLFSSYITTLYQMKANATPGTPKYLISKMLMNNLYGKFGMSPVLSEFTIQDLKRIDFKNIVNYNLINEDDNLFLIEKEIIENDLNINVSIALGVTANARILMAQFFNNPELTGDLLYTDTDSIFCTKELANSYVGKQLGQMKLEHVCKEFVSILPKVYALKDDNDKITIKAKGATRKMDNPLIVLNELLLNDNLDGVTLQNNKMFKDIEHGCILEINMPYQRLWRRGECFIN